jgi:succinate dehydrogenase (ubiquinone) membrane anchor subunit
MASFTKTWKIERIVSVLLVPAFASYWVLDNPRLPDTMLTVLLPVHCFYGLESCITDYIPKRKFPALHPIANLGLYGLTGLCFLGLAKMNYDVGLKKYAMEGWNAKKE